MICTSIDSYMQDLCYNKLYISWRVTLTDGTDVYGHYDRPGFENPW